MRLFAIPGHTLDHAVLAGWDPVRRGYVASVIGPGERLAARIGVTRADRVRDIATLIARLAPYADLDEDTVLRLEAERRTHPRRPPRRKTPDRPAVA